MDSPTWKENLRNIFDSDQIKEPSDVTRDRFEARLAELRQNGITIPSDLDTSFNNFFTERRDTPASQDSDWDEFVKDLWALAYLDDNNTERWFKAYSKEEWAQAHPGQQEENFSSEELIRLRRRFVYRKVAQNYERFFHWQVTNEPGWI